MITADRVAKPTMSRVPPELQGAVPRDVRLTGAGAVAATFAVATAAAAFIAVVVMSVAYNRTETSWVAGDRPSPFPLWAIPLVAVSLLTTGYFVARSVRQQWILLSEGRAALARVTGFNKVHREHKHKAYRVSYEFQTLSGARQTSKCEIGKAPPPIGSVIPIVYHRDQPAWSATYPLALVRPSRRG